MDSPGGYPESPLDQDDIVYPCKGCGEILEEGKAFELAGNRWHIDCFRCNTCGTLLDSDANLLLLGDGSLICNNCTYSCNHCGNKIEDLAILTGDQAFCANCFRCRNCKRKIENLRYARTSQGIFCMACHESLMARRRKKSKRPPAPAVVPKTDKSLPALPPSADPPQAGYTPELDTPSEVFSEPPTSDISPRPPQPRRNESSPANFRRDASPASLGDHRKDTLTLPASTYKATNNHHEVSDIGGDDGTLLPFALDPNPAPGPSPLGKTRYNENHVEAVHNKGADNKSSRDYFNRPTGNHREVMKENRSRSASTERDRQPTATPSSPHIAYQEKGRQASDHITDSAKKRSDPVQDSPLVTNDRSRSQHANSPSASQSTEFKLQEVPKSKKAGSRRGSKSEARSHPHASPSVDIAGRMLSPQIESTSAASPAPVDASQSPLDMRSRQGPAEASQNASYSSTQKVERPVRGDSLTNPLKQSGQRKDIPSPSPTTPTIPSQERPSIQSSHVNGGYSLSSSVDSVPPPPLRSAGRLPPPVSAPATETYTSPRPPPAPPAPPAGHKTTESVSTVQSEQYPNISSPMGLPRYSAQGDFSMDEDFTRLLGQQDNNEKEGGVLRRVSNAMSKHGRTFSDRSVRTTGGHKKWPTNGSIDISSPTVASPDSKEEVVNLRNELRRAQQRIAELEAEKNGLQESVNSAHEIKSANNMLREKRNTMAVLDTQRELVIRELESLTEHIKKAKENSQALDINQLKSDVMKDFATSLQKLKDQLGIQIEDLITKRTNLTNEISNLIQMKDKGFQEYESLNAQNAKLQIMNRDLIESIQGVLKENKHHHGKSSIDGRPSANGLGIYQPHNNKGGKSDLSVDIQQIAHEASFSNLHVHEAEAEATMVQPQVVNIRKPKVNKFNWKKGGQAITKNVTKGFKGAFGSEARREDEYRGPIIGTPYGSVHSQPDFTAMTSMSSATRPKEDPQGQQRGWFGNKTPGSRPSDRVGGGLPNNSKTNLVVKDPSVLFGSDLTARCDYEKRLIPNIVTRCIEEVELRGMDQDGIYRKSGGNGQVTQLKAGFEKSGDFDISDQDLDIHAVTSALKKYLTSLPNPLITFELYDDFLNVTRRFPSPPDRNSEEFANFNPVLDADDERIAKMTEVVNELPKCHRDTLQFLIFHLSRVLQHTPVNLMTALNLAVCFGPTIMRPQETNRELAESNNQIKCVFMLLSNYKTIFGEE